MTWAHRPRRLSPRLRRYVASRLGANAVERLEAFAAEGGHAGQGAERVLTAIALVAENDPAGLEAAVVLARADWRDVLVAAGLADEDWPERLAKVLA